MSTKAKSKLLEAVHEKEDNDYARLARHWRRNKDGAELALLKRGSTLFSLQFMAPDGTLAKPIGQAMGYGLPFTLEDDASVIAGWLGMEEIKVEEKNKL